MVTSWASAQQAILDLEEAGLAVAEALERAEQLGIENWLHRPLSLQCATLALAGDWTEASEAAIQAVSLRETLQARLLLLDFSRHYEIEALVRLDNHELAQADVRRLGERLRTDGSDRRYWLVYHRMQAVLARGEGEIEAARRHLVEALTLAEHIGLPGEEWQIAAELAAAYRREGILAEAEEAVERARAVIAGLAADINDQRLRDRFQVAALDRVQLLAT
jgi:tetratricopeptide (TPR) repeat protein